MHLCLNCSELFCSEFHSDFSLFILSSSQGVRGNDGPHGPKGNLVSVTIYPPCYHILFCYQQIIGIGYGSSKLFLILRYDSLFLICPSLCPAVCSAFFIPLSSISVSQGPQGEPGPPGQQGTPGTQVRTAGDIDFFHEAVVC